jgi:transcriptional regulator with XRE-family HTH domain
VDDRAATKRFAENLAAARKQAGLTIEALAARSETHRSQVSEYLGGRAQPKIGTLARLAGALGVPPAALLDGITFEPAEKRGQFKIAPAKRKK